MCTFFRPTVPAVCSARPYHYIKFQFALQLVVKQLGGAVANSDVLLVKGYIEIKALFKTLLYQIGVFVKKLEDSFL